MSREFKISFKNECNMLLQLAKQNEGNIRYAKAFFAFQLKCIMVEQEVSYKRSKEMCKAEGFKS